MKDMKHEEDKKSIDDFYGVDVYDDFQVSSSTECTGLIPAMPETDSELEAYEEMYPFLTKASSKNDDSHKM